MFNKKSKCSIINAPCPMNGDPERGTYCPHWSPYQETNDVTGVHRTREGCDIPAMREWMKSVCDSGWISGKFINMMANEAKKAIGNG